MLTPDGSRRRRRRPIPPALLALVGSVGLHVGAVVVLLTLEALGWMPQAPQARPVREVEVALRPMSADQWAANRGEKTPSQAPGGPRVQAEHSPAPKKDVPPKQPDPDRKPPAPHVATAPGNGQTSPDARFSAETSNKVERQTVARDRSPEFRNPMPRRTTTVPTEGDGRDDVEHAQIAGNEGLGDDDRPLLGASQRQLALEIPDVRGRDELKVEAPASFGPGPTVANRTQSEELKGNSDRLRIQPGQPSAAQQGAAGRVGSPGALNLFPSQATLDRITGSAPSDLLITDELEEGDATFLNTREWKYASFYTRLKQGIGRTWNPIRELHRRDPTLGMYAGRDRVTVVSVTLGEKGEVKDVYVVRSSGLDFLDLEAMQAFYRAQPFPNLPAGMKEADGTVRFNFSFAVILSEAPRVRMFRSR
jgi:TonB family protein